MSVKIYYLDDEFDLLSVFEDTFEDTKIEVCGFTDSAKAIESVNSSPPDIFFIDYRLPNITGIEVALQIKAKIPMVLLTADSKIAHDPIVTELFSAVFPKPFPTDAINKFIQSILRLTET